MTAEADIVRLGAGDAALLRGANRLFGDAFAEPDTYQGAPPDDAWLDDLLRNRDFIAVVAKARDEIVGALAGYALPKFERARREIYIYDLAVAEAWRRRGIATALIGEVQAFAHEVGAWTVFVQADYGDDPAIRLYSGLGTREDVIHFDIPPRSG